MVRKTKKETERRVFERAKRVLSLQYKIVKSKTKNYPKNKMLSTTEDMSFEGVSFYSDVELKHGDILDVQVVMSGILDIYNGKAEVKHVSQRNPGTAFLIGVKFQRKPESKKQAKKSNPAAKR